MGAPELLALSLGLSVIVAALGWTGGRGVERLSADPGFRERAWAAALILPVLPPLAIGLILLTPPPIHEIAFTPVSLPTVLANPPVEVDLAAPAAGGVFDPRLAAWAVLVIAIVLAAARLAALALRAQRLIRVIRETHAPEPAVTQMVQGAARDLAVRPPVIRVSATAAEAMLAGLGRTHLILPTSLVAAMTEPTAARAVIAHELAHLKRGDHRALWLEETLIALLAVNPLMPLLRARRAAAREEACDALALAGATPDARRAYARSLIEALRSRSAPQDSGRLIALTFTGAKTTTALRRLSAVMNPAPAAGRGPRLVASGLGGLIVALAGAGSMAVAAERDAVVRIRPAPAAPPTTIEEQPRPVVLGASARALLNAADRMEVGTAPAGSDVVNFIRPLTGARPISGKEADEPARSSLTPDQETRYRNATAGEYQDMCRSSDIGDRGFCAGVMFSVLARAPQNGVCAPTTTTSPDVTGSDANTLVERGRRELAGMRLNAGERAYEFALRALRQAYPCNAAGALRGEMARMMDQNFVPLTVAVDIQGRSLSVQGDETLRVVLTDENGAVMNTHGTVNGGIGRASGPLGPLGMAIAVEDFPGPGEPTRTYTLSGEIRGPGRSLRYIADPVALRLTPGARRADLRPTLRFRPANALTRPGDGESIADPTAD